MRTIDAVLAMRAWPVRRWLTAVATAAAFAVVVAIPTALIPTPLFGREIPPTWWAWPALVTSSVLAGVLVATYVAPADGGDDVRAQRRGMAGGLLTFFAVGCPVCNKLVLVALGSAGAITWFEPVQPFLQIAAIGVLLWALRLRLRGELACAVPAPALAAARPGPEEVA